MIETSRRRFIAAAFALAVRPLPASDRKGLDTPNKIGKLVLAASNQEGAFDCISVDCPFVFHRKGLFYMTYFGLDDRGVARDLVATSEDLLHPTKRRQVVIDVGAPGSVDSSYAP